MSYNSNGQLTQIALGCRYPTNQYVGQLVQKTYV
jgi:hypothetical protein